MDCFPNPTLLSRESGTKYYYYWLKKTKKKQISKQTKAQTPNKTKGVIICMYLHIIFMIFCLFGCEQEQFLSSTLPWQEN